MAQAGSIQEQLERVSREGEERDARRLAQKLDLPYLDVSITPAQVEALALLPEEKARQFKVAPFQLKYKDLSLAAYDPMSETVKLLVKELEDKGYKIHLFVASRSALNALWRQYQFVPKPVEEITGRFEINAERFVEISKKLITLDRVKEAIGDFFAKGKTFIGEAVTVGQILETILGGALGNRASDVHFEPEEKDVHVRFRVDGLLHDVYTYFPYETYQFVLARLKLLANLKLNVTDEPQDGRFTIAVNQKAIEVRMSIIPAEYGETIVMRLLDPEAIKVLNLTELGLRPDDLALVEEQLKAPNGMILNTGPTGSGKTTTLYAFLVHKQSPEIKIITIEDPIEYHLTDIEQTQVNPEANYTFATGLRSIMRQDPDVILVGEIRDEETAGIAIQAALTGHLVFSTVHANSAAGAIPRLLDLKVKSSSIGPALNLVIAQRLVRRLCVNCRVPQKPPAELVKKIENFLSHLPARVNRKDYEKITIYEPKGCEQCGNIGYKGRIAVFELMEVGAAMEDLITPTVSEVTIERQAMKDGMVTMQQDGILKVITGVTTFDEVEAVTGTIKW